MWYITTLSGCYYAGYGVFTPLLHFAIGIYGRKRAVRYMLELRDILGISALYLVQVGQDGDFRDIAREDLL